MREVFRLAGRITLEGAEYVGKKLDGIDQDARKLGRSLDNTGRAISKVGKNLTQWVSGPLLAIGAVVTKFGADFESAMTNSTAIMGDLSDEMKKKLSDTAREVGTTTKFSATEAAQAYEFLASAGYDAERSIAALPKVAAFAQAANTDLSRATTLLADAQSALGLASQDAAENMENMTRVSDVLVKANTLANASTEQFSEALTNKAAAALRLVNKDVEEGVAVLAALADQGVKGAAAGDQLNIVLRDLQKAAIKNKKAFDDAGIAVYDNNGNLNNMADIVSDLEKRFTGMSDEQKRSEIMMLGFQDRSVSAMMTLMGTSDAIRDYEKALKAAGGTTDEIAEKRLKNFWTQMDLIKKKIIDVALTLWEDLQPVLMDHLVPVLEAGVEKLKAMSQWFTNLDPPVKKMVIAITGALAVLGPTLIIVGKMVSAVKLLIPVFVLLKKEFILLNAVMKANPILAVITVVMALAMAATYLYQNWDKVSAWLAKTWTWIANIAQDVFSAMKIKILEFARGAVEAISKVTQYIPGLGTEVEKAKESLDKLITAEQNKRAEMLAARLEEAAKSTERVAESAEDLEAKTKALTGAIEEQGEAVKTLTAEEKQLIEDRKKFEEEWTKKLFEQAATRLELLNAEEEAALAQAENLEADRTAIEAYYKAEREKIAKEEVASKTAFGEQWKQKLLQQQQSMATTEEEQIAIRLELLRMEKEETIKNAKEQHQDTAQIVEFYEKEELRIVEEYAKATRDAREKYETDWNQKLKDLRDERTLSQAADLEEEITIRLARLEEQKKAELKIAEELHADKQAIMEYFTLQEQLILDQRDEAYRLSAEASAGAFIDFVDSVTSGAKTLAEAIKEMVISSINNLQKKILAEAMAAEAIAWALSLQTFGASLVHIATVAAKVLPAIAALEGVKALVRGLKHGATVKSGTGGILANVGEGDQDELVLPMETGVEVLAEKLLQKISAFAAPRPSYAYAGGGSSSYAYDNRREEVHLHIGTLIADDRGLKELERRLAPIRKSEQQRRES